ncbi:MAG: sensor histidine kinase [Firmicutes bacterium]|nr:sensor histidine kinase [Bacillota bacterium]
MKALHDVLKANEILIYFVYGLVYFLLGFAIALRSRSFTSNFRLARSLWYLAGFGFLHGASEWGSILIPLQETWMRAGSGLIMRSLHAVQVALSFACLLRFGTGLVGDTFPRYHWLKKLPGIAFALWLVVFVVLGQTMAPDYKLWHNTSLALSRYFMALPAAILSAVGLFAQVKDFHAMGLPRMGRNLSWAGVTFGIHSFFSGLVVNPAKFFPASKLNTETFFATVDVQVAVFRALAGASVAYFMTRALEMFEIESRRRVEEAEKTRAILEERERFGRDLHDDIIQSIYATGLILESAMERVETGEVRETIRRALERLNRIIGNLRAYIMGLNPADYQADTLVERLDVAVEEFSQHYPVRASLAVESIPEQTISGERLGHVQAIVRESLANVGKHARASHVKVLVKFSEDQVEVTVRDDGAGFDPDEAKRKTGGQGQGLKNIARRVELLGGEFRIKSSRGRGTELTFTFPTKVTNQGPLRPT